VRAVTEPEKKLPPVAVCTVCGEFSYRVETINNQCASQHGGKRCRGVFGSAINDDDWQECPSCHGAETIDGKPCAHCAGVGWRFVRDRRRR